MPVLTWEVRFADGSALRSESASWRDAVGRGRVVPPVALTARLDGRPVLSVAGDAFAHHRTAVCVFGEPAVDVPVFGWFAGGRWTRAVVGPDGSLAPPPLPGPPPEFVVGVVEPAIP